MKVSLTQKEVEQIILLYLLGKGFDVNTAVIDSYASDFIVLTKVLKPVPNCIPDEL